MRALNAALLFPGLAAVVVGDGDEAGEGESVGGGVERAEVSVEGGVGQLGLD